MSLERAPAWARTELEKLVAGMIVHRADGNQRAFEILQDEAGNLVEYFSLDPDEVFFMYGDPETDPTAVERARAAAHGLVRSQLGAFDPGADTFVICKYKNTNPEHPGYKSIAGFIHYPALRRLSTYRLVIVDGQFRTLRFAEDCTDFGDLMAHVGDIEANFQTQWGSLHATCIEDLSWDDVIDVILADLGPIARGVARKRMKEIIDRNQEKCFGVVEG